MATKVTTPKVMKKLTAHKTPRVQEQRFPLWYKNVLAEDDEKIQVQISFTVGEVRGCLAGSLGPGSCNVRWTRGFECRVVRWGIPAPQV